jgi:hypothetical protein
MGEAIHSVVDVPGAVKIVVTEEYLEDESCGDNRQGDPPTVLHFLLWLPVELVNRDCIQRDLLFD